jgi:quercetin dioxygenase-like cupin family protein
VIRSKVNNGSVTTYKAGESWSELPGDRHAVSAMPARRNATIVVLTGPSV